jgi:hypothetical protein
VVTQGLLRDLFSAFEGVAPGHGADAIDEYRELTMLAHAWEHGSLMPGSVEQALGRGDGVEGTVWRAAERFSRK